MRLEVTNRRHDKNQSKTQAPGEIFGVNEYLEVTENVLHCYTSTSSVGLHQCLSAAKRFRRQLSLNISSHCMRS